jgi:MinD-like ATPase involved in chromosome partitioning or flagellar assembly
MATDRYVVLGLALPRSPWFRAVAHWATAGSLPVEFVKCVSVEDLAARLRSGRTFSALVVDGAVPGLDRDVVDQARRAGCAVVVAGDGRVDWTAAGATALLPIVFDQRQLLDVLRAHCTMISRSDVGSAAPPPPPTPWHGSIAAVCGAGGTGASTVAIALAQAMAADVRHGGSVVLADLARPGEQAMLHDARDVVPGIEELAEAHRSGSPTSADVRAYTFSVEGRGYSLLLGLRRARSWSALRPRAVAETVAGLARAFRVVVCDCDADVEGEAEGGSADVEDRNAMARSATAAADVVFAVGTPGVKGVHALARVIGDLMAAGVEGGRIVAVVNRAPRNPRARAEIARAVAALTPTRRSGLAAPVFLPERRVDEALRDGSRLPAALGAPLAVAFEQVVGAQGRSGAAASTAAAPVPEPIVAGSLGHWGDDDAEAG